ncbi:MAG: ABC transporter ATP-binding protein [Acidimicrobiales bacterium]
MTALFSAEGISKHFGGVVALSEMSLEVDTGEAVGLVGPNGAGKTTLFNCLLGIVRPDTGSVFFDGRRIDGLRLYKRARLGIGRTFQRLELFSGMTVLDHLLVALRARGDGAQLWKDLVGIGGPQRSEIDTAMRVLGLVGLADSAGAMVESLTLGHGRLLELARAIVAGPRLLMLDEPSSGLDSAETAVLVDVLKSVRSETGTAILLVEHDLDMVSLLVEKLYVLDFGKLIAAGPIREVLADASVRRAYLGGEQ